MNTYLGLGLLLVMLVLINPVRKRLYLPLVWVYGLIFLGICVWTAFWIATKVIPKVFQNPDMGSLITSGAFVLACLWGISSFVIEQRSKAKFKRWAKQDGYAGKSNEMTDADRARFASWLKK